jgi:hypothetical protein
MGMSRNQRRLAAWIACFAVLLASLMPSISHAIAAARLGNVATLATVAEDAPCHAEGGVQSAVHEAESDANHSHDGHSHDMYGQGAHPMPASPSHHDAGLHFEHCPFCFTHAGSFGLTPIAEVVLPQALGISVMPALFYHSPVRLFTWTTTQPRAPPPLS